MLGDLTVDPCPPSMQIPAEVERATVGYAPYNGRAVLPRWLWEPPDRPRIALTWGATTTSVGGAKSFLPPRVVAALAGADAEIVVAVGRDDLERLGPVPDGVRAVTGVALHQLLPTCSALIHQGGSGGTLTGVHHGVPQLVLPQLPDQVFGAARLATARPDGPHMIPPVFAWDGTDLVMMTKRGSRTVANLRRAARARAALGTARDVVLVDGPVSLREPAELPGRIRALFDRLPLNPDRVPGVIALCLRPERISAWRGLPEIPGRTVMSGGDWLG
ncbi:nucleotide disphospho-sugar-binding domain-containing protein [Streptosporangium sandarakinum]|uniref:nucleotide disphospho-sugar-binding domain-containing protein n=1 Tax=Streptosporangium sandarakinum TaxID=1260955 RepID=UPI0033A84AD4